MGDKDKAPALSRADFKSDHDFFIAVAHGSGVAFQLPGWDTILKGLGLSEDEIKAQLIQFAIQFPDATVFEQKVTEWISQLALPQTVMAAFAQAASDFKALIAKGSGPVTHNPSALA